MFDPMLICLVLVFVVFGINIGSAFAQIFPTKPVTIVSPWSAGTTNDVLARIISEPLSKYLGQPIILEDKVGASGAIGAEMLKAVGQIDIVSVTYKGSSQIVPDLLAGRAHMMFTTWVTAIPMTYVTELGRRDSGVSGMN